MSNVGKKLVGLKSARERSGITQQALACVMGVHVDTIKDYESGKKGCKSSRIPTILNELGVSETQLLSANLGVNPPVLLTAKTPVAAAVSLTLEQQHAINLPPLNSMVLAGAGSGKTKVVVDRVMKLIKQDAIEASSIVVLTFTEKAAEELKERISRLYLAENGTFERLDDIFIGTIHKYCNYLIRKGLPEYLSYELLDGTEQYMFILRYYSQILPEANGLLKLDGTMCKYASSLGLLPSLLNTLSEGDLNLSQVPAGVLDISRNYSNILNKKRKLDFSSLLKIVDENLISNPSFQKMISKELRYLIVDEYQDTNASQERVISNLVKVGRGNINLTVVGDDDQSIYGWNNARIENLIDFPLRYDSVEKVKLMHNFRSGEGILDCAYRIVGKNQTRCEKQVIASSFHQHEDGNVLSLKFDSPEEEGRWIAEKVRFFEGYPYQSSVNGTKRGLALSDMAVLVRTKAQAKAVIDAFEDQGVRYQFRGNSGLVSGSRLGHALASIFYYLSEKKTIDAEELCDAWKEASLGLSKKVIKLAIGSLERFKDSKFSASNHSEWAPQQALHKFLDTLDLDENLIPNNSEKNLFSSAEQAFWTIGQFSSLIAKFEGINAGRKNVKSYYNNFADYLEFSADTTFAEEKNLDKEQNVVSVLTIHSSKGLEWPVVFMPGMVKNKFPIKRRGGLNLFHIIPEVAFKDPDSYKTPESEERRLAFVAMTRAEKFLFMSWAPSSSNLYKKESVFLTEIGKGHDNYALKYFNDALYESERLATTPNQHALSDTFPFSGLFEYRACPYAFKLRNTYGFSPVYNEAIGFGNILHNCIHDYHEQRLTHNKVWGESEIEALVKKHFYMPFSPSPELRLKLYMSALHRFKAHHEDYQKLSGIEYIEKDISYYIGDVRIDGRMDMLRTLREGKEEIIDFKSAKAGTHYDPSETLFQLSCYALAHRSNTGRKPDYIKPIYIESHSKGGSSPDPIAVLDESLDSVEREIKGFVTSMQKGVSPRQPCISSMCEDCDVKVLCPKKRQKSKLKS